MVTILEKTPFLQNGEISSSRGMGLKSKTFSNIIAGLTITLGNRTISGHILLVYGQILVCAVDMSGHTRDCEEPSSLSGAMCSNLSSY